MKNHMQQSVHQKFHTMKMIPPKETHANAKEPESPY